MKKGTATKLISLSLVLAFATSAASCSSRKREYRTIKDTDTWYECSSFEVSDLYPAEDYEYCYFETVGANEDNIYVMAEAVKHFDGDISKMTDEDYISLYEQSILEFSYDGVVTDRTDFDPVAGDGIYKAIQKAWLFNGELNILEQVFDSKLSINAYYLNGKALTIPDVYNYYDNQIFIEDIYTSDGYTLYKLYVNSWIETFALVRPDGSFEELYLDNYINGFVEGSGSFIPTDDGKVMLPVYLNTGEDIFVSVDPSTGEIEELKGLYGTSGYWLEYASGKTVARDYNGFSFVDNSTGELTPICDYIDIDALVCDVGEAQLLYVSDDGSEMILGYESYERYSSSTGYRIMRLTRADSNPNAGKTELIISTNNEFTPERSDFFALQQFNKSNGSFFLKYVLPVEENGTYKEVDADIYLTYDPAQEPSDKNKYLDLAPYLDLNDGSYKEEYFGNAIDAAKSGDAIYRVPLDISASGIITASSNVPQGQNGFTFDSYVRFVDEVCNGTDPMSKTPGYKLGKAEYFTKLFMNMSEVFIYDGKVHLNGDEFRELVLFVEEYGSEEDMSENDVYKTALTEHSEAVQETIDAIDSRNASLDGRTGAVYGDLSSFYDYIDCYIRYGDGLGIYSLPSFDGRGPQTISHEFVSVSVNTSYPDACTEFAKLLLSYDIQKTMYGNPVNRAALRTIAEEQLNMYNAEIDLEKKYGIYNARNVPQESIGKYIDILSSSYAGINAGGAIEQILREESSSYFAGEKSLDDVITVMQKRIQTVLNETA